MAERQRGRPRSATAHRAVLESARDLLTAVGYDKLTIEAIAGGAGVAKQTVYRWWPSKAAIVAEAALSGYLITPQMRLQDTGDVVADLRSWLGEQLGALAHPATSAMIRALAAAAADSDAKAARLYEHTTGPTRDQLTARLLTAVRQGQLRADADVEAAADLILGSTLYRALAGRPPTGSGADGVVDLLVRGLAAPPPSGEGTPAP